MQLAEAKQERPLLTGVRLRGTVQFYVAEKQYGFITVAGMKDAQTGKKKQYHFHRNSVRHPDSIAAGVVVEFTPKVCPVADKCDKATDIEVVG